MLLPTSIAGTDVYLLIAEPDYAASLQTRCRHITERTVGLSQREDRAGFSASLRWTLAYTALFDRAQGMALRAALRGYGDEPILCPMWPAQRLASEVATAPLTGGLLITWEPDWSAWELHTGAPVGSYSAAAYRAPVLYGRFDGEPQPAAETDELGPCPFSLYENGPAEYAIAPRSTATTAGPTLHSTAWPIFAEHVQYTRAMASGGIDLRVARDRIGYGRDEVTEYAPQTPRSNGTLQFEGDSEAAMRLIALFHACQGNVSPLWWPAAHAEWRLAADATSGSATVTLEDEPVAPYPEYIALRHANGTIAARQVLSVAGTAVTLASAPGNFARRSTSLLPLFFGRFVAPELALEWSTPRAIAGELQMLELPTETDVPEGETFGTTIGPQPAKWWGYVVTDGVNTWRLTSYESEIDAGETLGTFVHAPIDHGDMTMELNLARHDVSLTIGSFDGSPFDRLRVDIHAPRLRVQIYEGTVADPDEAQLIFSGRVRAPRFQGAECTCRLAGPTALLDMRGPLAVSSPRCWVPLFSPLCGLVREDLEVAVDLSEIQVDGTLKFVETGTAGFPVTPADWFRYGYAERLLGDGTVQRYRIAGSVEVGIGETIIPDLGTLESETIAWQASLEGAGGTYTSKSLRIANNLVTLLKTKSYFSKIKYLLPLLGGNLAAGLTPLIDTGGKGRPTNTAFVDADFSEAGGLHGDGTSKVLTLPFYPDELGASLNGGVGYWELAISFSGSSVYLAGSNRTNSGLGDYRFGLDMRSTVQAFVWGTPSLFGGSLTSAISAHYYGQRSAANSRRLFRDGALLGSSSTSETPSGAHERQLQVLGGWEGSQAFRNGVCTVAYLTDGTLSDADAADLHSVLSDALQTYKTYSEVGDELIISILGAVSPAPSSFPEDSWTLVPGCDKSYPRCKALGNEGNFRGQPRFPKTNPAMVSVKQETASGGKK